MAKVVKSISLTELNNEIMSKCCLKCDCDNLLADAYETSEYEILLHYVGESDELAIVEILDLKKVYRNIDNKDCLPDVGLLDYKDNELNLDLKDVTLRKLYKEVLKKIFE